MIGAQPVVALGPWKRTNKPLGQYHQCIAAEIHEWADSQEHSFPEPSMPMQPQLPASAEQPEVHALQEDCRLDM